MNNRQLERAFVDLSTPHVFDACLKLGVALRASTTGMRPLEPRLRIAGRVLPVRHYGSVDVFLEAMCAADPGDILVIDNQGRMNEGCIGDLTALEALSAGLTGIIVWGVHRDSAELRKIDFPVFSLGACPMGPQRLDPREADALSSATFGSFEVIRDDVVFADVDGVVFVANELADEVLAMARTIWGTERRQVEKLIAGKSLREQFRFDEFLEQQNRDPDYSFREHLRKIGGAIEE